MGLLLTDGDRHYHQRETSDEDADDEHADDNPQLADLGRPASKMLVNFSETAAGVSPRATTNRAKEPQIPGKFV